MNFFKDYGITFLNPWLLCLLIVIPLLAYLKGRLGNAPAIIFSSIAPLRGLGNNVESRSGNFSSGLIYLALGLLFLALARPQLGKSLSHIEASGIDIMIVLDVSGSMMTEDYVVDGHRTNRIDTIKEVTRRFIEGRPNDRIGIIAFGGYPYVVSPLTLDHDWLLQNLERVRIGMVEDTTAIGSGIAAASRRLMSRDSKSKVIILLTDGDNNAGKIAPETAAEAAKALGIKLHAIGAGTSEPAPFPVTDQFGNKRYEMAVFPFNAEGLRKITQIAGGQFYRAADTHSMENIFAQIDKMEKTTVSLTRYKQYRDLFPWFIGAGCVLLAVEVLLAQTLWRKLP